jgi:methyltransferase-like protein
MTAPIEAGPGAEQSLYDVVPYPGCAYPQTHPDRLATLATLFGLEPPPLETSRVLELGCGDAGNLVAMAVSLPGAHFLGVDASQRAIARGRRLVAALRLPNVALEAAPLEQLEPTPVSFDYVIAHGVYSWVAPPVRDRLLELCRSALSEQGVAYVSYNTLPGGRLKQALRDMLLFHTAGVEEPIERLEQTRSLLHFLIDGWSAGHEFGTVMRHQAERLLVRSDETLFHDELAPVSDPVYFHEFATHSAQHGLQYLAEADFFEMQTGVLPERAGEELARVGDLLAREQYLDFIKGRMFRQTLLCRAELALDRSPRALLTERLAVSSPARPSDGQDRDGRVRFEGPTGATLTTDHPLVIEALERVGESWPDAVWVRDLLPERRRDEDRRAVCNALLRCYAGNLVQLHTRRPALTTAVSERPEAGPLARHQAGSGRLVTNQRYEMVRIEDDLGRRLVTLLDGKHDHASLARSLHSYLRAVGREAPDDLEDGLERSLQGLAALALLCN